MAHDICKIDIGANGVTSACDKKPTEINIITVNARPFRLNVIPDIPIESQRKKEKIIKSLLQNTRDCYRGKLEGGVCIDPIDIIVFKWEHCPACEVHVPTIKKRLNRIAKNAIPVKYRVLDVKDTESIELYKQSGCGGTPCVILRDPRTKQFIHIAEGIDQDVGFYSNLFGISNPIYNPMNKKTVPRNLVRTGKVI